MIFGLGNFCIKYYLKVIFPTSRDKIILMVNEPIIEYDYTMN